MANIDGGALSFKSVMENDQMNKAIEETLRRVQGLSDATVAGGKQMDKAFLQTADGIRQALGQIGAACEIHETELAKLEDQYEQLGRKASAAFTDGRDEEYQAIEETRAGIQGEIAVRKQALEEARNLSNELEKEAAKREEATRQVEENAKAHQSLRARIRELENEMALLIKQGIDEQSEAYKALVNELGRLLDIQGDIAKQGKILANDEAKFQGIIQGLSGLSGAFSTATGAISLFAGENENLQKVMTKVQSVMAIAMGMQSVAQTLNKDSAFQLVTLNGLKKWWAGIVAKATVAETAEAGATQLNTAAKEQNAAATGKAATTETLDTAAKGANTAAATAGTAANLTLAGAFRAVGLAIKSIPVFGWIITGIAALAAVVAHFNNKAKEAKEAQAKLVEQHYKTIGSINELSEKWKRLGNDMEGKKKLIKESQKVFEDYGVVVRDDADAENLLIKNKDAFVAAQIAKVQSLALLQSDQYQDAMKKSVAAQLALQEATKEWNKTVGERTGRKASTMKEAWFEVKDGKITKYGAPNANSDMMTAMKDAKEAELEMQKIYEVSEEFKMKHDAKMAELNKEAIEKNKHTVAGRKALLEQELEDLKTQRGQLVATDTKAIADYDKRIKAKQAEIDKLDPKNSISSRGASISNKDPFVEQLNTRKSEYERFKRWVESSDNVVKGSIDAEFGELLKQGETYLDYLKNQRDAILSTNNGQVDNERSERLRILNDQIAQETKKEENDERERQEERIKQLLDDYSDIATKKKSLETKLLNDIELLNKQYTKAATKEEKDRINSVIKYRRAAYNKEVASLLSDAARIQIYISNANQELALSDIARKRFLWDSDREKAILETRKKFLLTELALYKRIQNEAPTSEIAQEIDLINEQIEELNESLDKMPVKKFNEILDDISKITSALGNLDGEVGEIFSSISSSVGQMKVAFDDNAKAADRLSVAIQGVTDVINMLSRASAERKHIVNEFYQDQITLAHKYALALNEVILTQSEMNGSGLITDYSGNIKSSFDALTDSTAKYKESLQKLSGGKVKVGLEDAVNWLNVAKGAGSGAGSGAAAGATIGSFIPALGTAIGGFVGGLVGGFVGGFAGLFGGKKKKEIYGGLLDVYPELINSAGRLNVEFAKALLSTKNLDENTKQLLQNSLDWEEATKKSQKQITDIVTDLTDKLGNNLRSAIVDAWKAGEDGSKKMFEAAGQSLEKFVEELMFSLIFSEVLKQFRDKVVSSISPNGDGTIVDDYKWLNEQADIKRKEYTRYLDEVKQEAQKQGVKAWTSNGQTSKTLTGAVKGVTEETASIVAGRLNAMRINQGEANNMLRQQLSTLNQIAINTTYNKHLEKLDGILSALKGQQNDHLRSQGLQ